ncbi:MAG: bluetail domain-containing putative surface protein [Nostoc sp. CmiVER01]|uniref:calcium-binding protein n=1 Tax=Nostoc sp. CmiVER01 TaxID=3075384 RepID=UPI002AD2D007|nr:calcium-binding protein [Nostoc sp. CmiVER01]MDZ8121717.1 calcium-binding protein [Nostoc sp. CmiVER01]
MADTILFQGNRYIGDTTSLAQFYGAQTATNFEILNSSGVLTDSFVGVNFTYRSTGFFNSGTITSFFGFGNNGQLIEQDTNLNLDVATRNSLLSIGTSSYDYGQYFYRGNDSILGSAEDDSFDGSKGNDTINGGAGIDVLSFQKFSEGVIVNLSTGQAITSFGTSVISNVEDIEGSAFGDILTGNSGNNQTQGFGGADRINGGAGFDTAVYFDATSAVGVDLSSGVVIGGSGNDTLVSIERVLGSRFSDVLIGSNANESFLGGFGDDSIDGGGGIDTVEYGFVGSRVIVNLASGFAIGGAGTDSIFNVENVKGSIFDDILFGNSGANVLNGDNGNDGLNGGAGADTLTGGQGADLFAFQFGQSLVSGSDRITDFTIGTDKIGLLSTDTAAVITPSTFTRAADKTATTLQNLVNQVFTDANGAVAGNQALGVNGAALVRVTSGAIAGTYLAINNSTAGFQANSDLLVNLTGITGTLPALGNITVSSFFA